MTPSHAFGLALSILSAALSALGASSALGQAAPTPKLVLQTAGPVAGLDFSPDGAELATAGPDGIVRLWNAKTGELTRELPGPGAPNSALAFSPEGRLAVAGWR